MTTETTAMEGGGGTNDPFGNMLAALANIKIPPKYIPHDREGYRRRLRDTNEEIYPNLEGAWDPRYPDLIFAPPQKHGQSKEEKRAGDEALLKRLNKMRGKPMPFTKVHDPLLDRPPPPRGPQAPAPPGGWKLPSVPTSEIPGTGPRYAQGSYENDYYLQKAVEKVLGRRLGDTPREPTPRTIPVWSPGPPTRRNQFPSLPRAPPSARTPSAPTPSAPTPSARGPGHGWSFPSFPGFPTGGFFNFHDILGTRALQQSQEAMEAAIAYVLSVFASRRGVDVGTQMSFRAFGGSPRGVATQTTPRPATTRSTRSTRSQHRAPPLPPTRPTRPATPLEDVDVAQLARLVANWNKLAEMAHAPLAPLRPSEPSPRGGSPRLPTLPSIPPSSARSSISMMPSVVLPVVPVLDLTRIVRNAAKLDTPKYPLSGRTREEIYGLGGDMREGWKRHMEQVARHEQDREEVRRLIAQMRSQA